MFSTKSSRVRAVGARTAVAAERTGRVGRFGAVLALALAVSAVSAGAAAAKVVTDPVTHQKFSVVPAIAGAGIASKPFSTSCTTSCTALTYHNGPVQHAEKDYLIFWAPSGHPIPYPYRAGVAHWFSDVAAKDYTGGNPFSVSQQYYDLSGPSGAKSFVPYGITYAGSVVDTTPYPANGCTDTDATSNPLPTCLTAAQIGAEVTNYITAHNLPTGLGAQYYVLTPVNVGSCFDSSNTSCSYTAYCAWHNYEGSSSNPTLYADMPWAYGMSGCDVDQAFGAGFANADALDPVVGVLSHEMNESMTDPELNAWYDGSGNENGDKCAYDYGSGGYGSTSGLANNGLGYWNVALNSTDQFLMQLEFDNHTSNCTVHSTFTQPTVTVGPSTATHGVSQAYTATVTDPYGVAYVAWDFGDGTKATTTTTSTSHTYATAGAKTLTVIVTDKQGNERKVTQTVTVS